jgi:hypothetical protein
MQKGVACIDEDNFRFKWTGESPGVCWAGSIGGGEGNGSLLSKKHARFFQLAHLVAAFTKVHEQHHL